MGFDRAGITQGFATAESPLVADLLHADSRPLEPALRENGDFVPPETTIPFGRYFDAGFARLE
ncbi:MAG TPA: hypothetical protein VMB71_09570, partial [Acetobacteraceae bacterium]|nr:hypothetical protein [Acetobacteraceae bacterium]